MAGTTQPTTNPRTDRTPEERFTIGLMLDVAAVLEAHGYGLCDERQLVELQQHLFHFLFGRSDGRCMDRTASGELGR